MTKTRKILHAADIHLDSPLRNLTQYEDAPADQIRDASRRALENLVAFAIDQAVDLVVIAGDLYDGDWPDQNTGLFFVSQATRLIDAGIPIAVIRGNHDAFNKMTVNLRLPKNPDGSQVMLSEKKVDTREFDFGDLSVAVHGRSYRKQHERDDLVKDYPAARGGMFNLGLLHSSLTGFDGHVSYAPCTPSQLADFGYDYWALGHIHQRGEHQIDGAAPVVFSGNLQGRKINEPGAKGCVLVDIDPAGKTTRTFHPLDVVRFEPCVIQVESCQRFDDIFEYYENWLEQKISEIDDRLLVPRVQLVGSTPMHRQLTRKYESLEASLRGISIHTGGQQVWLEKVKLKTRFPNRSLDADVQEDPNPRDADSGAIASVIAVVDQLKDQQPARPPGELFAQPDAVGDDQHWVKDELAILLSKLPKELKVDDAVLNVDDPDEVRNWIDQAAGELIGRLQDDH